MRIEAGLHLRSYGKVTPGRAEGVDLFVVVRPPLLDEQRMNRGRTEDEQQSNRGRTEDEQRTNRGRTDGLRRTSSDIVRTSFKKIPPKIFFGEKDAEFSKNI